MADNTLVPVAAQLSTSNGTTQDITTTSARGNDETPIAAIFVLAFNQGSTGKNEVGTRFSIGLFDGTNQFMQACTDADGQSSTDAFTHCRTDKVAALLSGADGSLSQHISANAFITNGVRINIDAMNAAHYIEVILIFGSSAVVGTFDPHDTVDTAVTVTPGIATDVLISLGSARALDSAFGHLHAGIGFAVNGGNQVSSYHFSDNNVSLTHLKNRVENNRGLILENDAEGTLVTLEYSNFTATQFDATSRDAGANSASRVGYLALALPDGAECGVLDTPTSTGDLDVTGLGIDAGAALFGVSQAEAVDAAPNDATAEGFGVAAAYPDTTDELHTMRMAQEQGVSTADTESYYTQSISSSGADNGEEVVADSFASISGGFRLGFSTTVHASAKKWIYFATEGEGINVYQKTIIDNITIAEQLILQFLQTITEDFTIGDSLSIRWVKNLMDDIGVEDTVNTIALFNNTVTEDLELSEDLTGSLIAINRVTDTLSLDEALTNKAVLHQTIQEAVAIQIGLNLGDEQYTGLVLNTRNLALTKYSGYNFNSFARIGDKYYGAADDGIYLLEGDDDNGTDIEAHLRTAIFDFNSDFQKRVPRAYLGLRGDGEVYLKAITNEEEVHWYRIQDVQEKFENNRVRMGRGVTSEYWQFELANVDGSFFELHDMTLIPVVLTRRVK